MTAPVSTQFQINFWKWWLIRKRQFFLVLAELLWPMLLIAALVLVHPLGQHDEDNNPTCYFQPRANPSAGMVDFVQSTLCNLNNLCYDSEEQEQIPSLYNNSKFRDLLVLGEPIFNDDKIQRGLESLPKALDVLKAAVKILNNSDIMEILDEDFLVKELFLDQTKVEDYFQTQNLTDFEAKDLMTASLKVSNLFFEVDSLKIKVVTCDPEKLATFVKSDNMTAIFELSEALCNLESSEISQLVKVVHENLDIAGLLDKGKAVANKTRAYNVYSGTQDIATFIENIWNTSMFRDMEIPEILHMSLWSEDFGAMLDTAMYSDDIEFKCLDTWSDLSLALMMEPQDYALVLETVSEVTGILHEIFEGFMNQGNMTNHVLVKRSLQPTGNEFANFADEIERFVRFLIKNATVQDCAMAIFENYPYIFDTKIDMYSKIKDTCQKTEVIMNRFINLYEPANCLIQSMENLMENDDQQMYSELINGLNDGLMHVLNEFTSGLNTGFNDAWNNGLNDALNNGLNDALDNGFNDIFNNGWNGFNSGFTRSGGAPVAMEQLFNVLSGFIGKISEKISLSCQTKSIEFKMSSMLDSMNRMMITAEQPVSDMEECIVDLRDLMFDDSNYNWTDVDMPNIPDNCLKMENHLMDMVNSNTAMNCFLQTGMEIAKKFKNKSLVDLANVLYYFDEIPQNVDQAHVWYNMYTEIQNSVMKYSGDSCTNKNIQLSDIIDSLNELIENRTLDDILMDLMHYGIPDGEDWETQIFGFVGKMWMSGLKYPEEFQHFEQYSNKSIAILSLVLKESVTSLKEIQKVFDDANAINEVTIPWQSVLPNLPKITQTISKILKNLPDFLSNSGPHIISGKYIQIQQNFIELLDSSWPCSAGCPSWPCPDSCIMDELGSWNATQDLLNILESDSYEIKEDILFELVENLKLLDEMISGILSSGWGKNIYMENMDEAFFGDIISVFDQIHINFTKTILYKDIECLLLEEGVNNCKNKTIIVMSLLEKLKHVSNETDIYLPDLMGILSNIGINGFDESMFNEKGSMISRLLGHLMNETGLDLPKNFTDELMKILNYIEMNGLDESMFNKNSSLISSGVKLLNMTFKHVMNETGLNLSKNFTDELMKVLNYFEMNGLGESMFSKNSSLISSGMKLIEMSFKHVINETGLDLPKNFTDELMNLLNYIEMNGLDESMFSKNSSLMSSGMKLIEMSLKLVMNETGFDLPKDVTNELMNLFNNIKMNGLDESMFNKNSSLISSGMKLLELFINENEIMWLKNVTNSEILENFGGFFQNPLESVNVEMILKDVKCLMPSDSTDINCDNLTLHSRMMRILKSIYNQTMIYQNVLEDMFGKNNILVDSVMKFLEDMSGNKTEMEWLEGIDKMLGTNITSVLGEFKNIDIIQNDFQCLISEVSNTPSSKCGNLTVSLRLMRILKLTLNQTLGLGLSSPDGILRLNLNQTLDFLNQTLNLGIFPEGNLKLTLNQIIDLAHLLPEGLLQYTSNQTTDLSILPEGILKLNFHQKLDLGVLPEGIVFQNDSLLISYDQFFKIFINETNPYYTGYQDFVHNFGIFGKMFGMNNNTHNLIMEEIQCFIPNSNCGNKTLNERLMRIYELITQQSNTKTKMIQINEIINIEKIFNLFMNESSILMSMPIPSILNTLFSNEMHYINKTFLIQNIMMNESINSLTQILKIFTRDHQEDPKVTIPWRAILPQIPSAADLIANFLTNMPKFVERITKLIEVKEYEKFYPLLMETLNSSWPCAGGISDQCIEKEWLDLNSTQKLLQIIEAYQVNLPNNFWNTTQNIFNQLKDVINSLLSKMSENEAEVENLNGEWFSEMEKAIQDLLMTWNTGFNNMSFIDVYKYLELALKIVNNNQVYDSELDFINKTLLIHDIVEKETMKSLTQILNVYTSTNGAVVTMPWNAILPQLPSVTDLIVNLLTNIPKIVERLTKIVEFKEYEQIYPLFMETLNSSWPCDGGMSNQCIQDEFMALDVIQDIDNIIKFDKVNLPDNFWTLATNQAIQFNDTLTRIIKNAMERETELQNLNKDWFNTMEQRTKDLFMAWNASLSNMTIPVGENLELALKCWKTFNQENQPECQNDFSILRIMRILRSILKDIDDQVHWMNEIYDTEFFDMVSKRISMIRNFTDAFNSTSDMESLLINAGLDKEIVDILKKSYTNINRLKFFDYTITEQLLGNTTELFRLFKFDEFFMFDKVEKAFVSANKTMIAKALNSAVEVRSIDNQVDDWRTESFMDLGWLESLGRLVDIMSIDAKTTSNGAMKLLKAMDVDTTTTDSIDAFLTIMAEGTIDEVLNGVFEMFETTNVMMGNDQIARNVVEMMNGLRELELIDILDMLLLQSTVSEVFINWDPVKEYMENRLNLSPKTVDIVSKSDLDIPGILAQGQDNVDGITILPDIFCNPKNLSNYIDITHNGAVHLNTTIEKISEKLCSITKSPESLFDLSEIIFQELNMTLLVHMALTVDNILEEGNVTREEAHNLIKQLEAASNVIFNYENDFNYMVDITTNYLNQNNSMTSNMGDMLCGDSQAFLFNGLPTDIGRNGADDDEDIDEIEDEEDDENFVAINACAKLESKLTTNEAGKFVWPMIAPFLKGKVLYTPITEFTNSLILKANQSASSAGDFMDRSKNFMLLGNLGKDLIKSQPILDVAFDMLDSKLVQEIINSSYPDIDLESVLNFDRKTFMNNLTEYKNVLDMMEIAEYAFDCYLINRFIPMNTETELEKESFKLAQNGSFYAGLVFLDSTPEHLQYKIRMGHDNVPTSNELKSKFWVPGPDASFIADLKYLRGFTQLQDLIDRAFLRLQGENEMITQTRKKREIDSNSITNNIDDIGVYTQEFPYPCFIRDNFLSSVYTTQVLTISVIFGFAFAMGSAIRNQIWERESKNAQMMEIMGMNPSVSWTVWILMTLLVLSIISGSFTLILKLAGLLKFSNPLLIFVVLFCGSLATLAYAFLMAVSMSKAVVGSIVSLIAYIISFTPFMAIFVLETSYHAGLRIALNLLMTTCFSFAFNYITKYEQQSIGLQWDNMHISPIEDDVFNCSYCCLFLLFDAMLYTGIGVLVLFLKRRNEVTNKGSTPPFKKVSKTIQDEENPNSSNTNIGVSLQNLTKIFSISGKEKRVAVNDLSLDFHVGEVTALLGHNGAGKSTMIKMLTGIEKPTLGTASVLGFDTWGQWGEVQKLIGLCPQQSILYDMLTPREHLTMYGKLKGVLNSTELETDVKRFLDCMEMTDIGDVQIRTLSEGMKRRICVALAFIGGSQVVILDEPTSGVDPIARRHIWDLISQFKSGRTIIFTTHHLDEAELLSDKLAIIHQGSLLASGTVSELKKQFGNSGFELTINLKENQSPDEMEIHVKNSVSNAVKLPKRHRKDYSLRYLLPMMKNSASEDVTNPPTVVKVSNNEDLNGLDVLFAILDNESERLGIANYTLECTTLEQIFLEMERQAVVDPGVQKLMAKVGMKEQNYDSDKMSDTSSNSNVSMEDTLNASSESSDLMRESLLQGSSLFFRQFTGLLRKRFLRSIRDWRYFLSNLVLPLLVLVFSMLLAQMKPDVNYKPLLLTPSIYGFDDQYSFVKSNDQSNMVLKTLNEPPGIGTICMESSIVNDIYPGIDQSQCSMNKSYPNDYMGPGGFDKFCECDLNLWDCDKEGNKSRPEKWKSYSGDVFFNLPQNWDVNDWILQTHNDFLSTRFGGFSIGSDSGDFDNETSGTSSKLIVWYNNKAYHALPSYTNAIHNAMLRSMVDPSNISDYGISTYSHPMRFAMNSVDTSNILQSLSDYGVSLMVLMALGFLPSGFIAYLIRERRREEKQVQMVIGVSKVTYWFATAFYDLMVILLFLSLCILIFVGFDIPTFTSRANLPAIFVLMLTFALASTAFVYCIEKAFNEPSMGQLVILCSTILIGMLTLVVTLVLQLLWWFQQTEYVYKVTRKIFLVFPPFALGDGLLTLTVNQATADIMKDWIGEDSYENPFEWQHLGLNIFVLSLQTFLFHLLNISLEYKWLQSLFRNRNNKQGTAYDPTEDEDVRDERENIENNENNPDTILKIHKLTKVFRRALGHRNIAVNDISIGVKSGECFGWLGLNGAGKSTTFKLLTGQMEPTSGWFSFGTGNGKTPPTNTMRMGYCPQMDALDYLLTVKETLEIYAKLRGLSSKILDKAVQKAMSDLDLQGHSNTLCGDLSGGTKRKVCAAISMLGSPHLILMDEPTSGMDAVTKRLVWRRIQKQMTYGDSAVVLTSHSMEECEFLCTRLAIMAKGKFRCLGSPDHIKEKFGHGYSVSLFFARDEDIEAAKNFVDSRFPERTNMQLHNTTIQFQVSKEPPSVIFGHILANKNSLGIQDFAVKHTTLDEVFINFADNSPIGSHNTKGGSAIDDNDDLRRRPTPVGASSDSDISQVESGSISLPGNPENTSNGSDC